MNTYKLILVTLLLVINQSFELKAQQRTNSKGTANTNEKIEQISDIYTQAKAFEGAILVARSGKVIYEKTFGYSDRSTNKLISTADSFQIASLTKPIVATLVLMLEEQGKLRIQDNLASYFPSFNNDVGKKITIEHLLNHTSGLPNHFAIEGWSDKEFNQKTSEQEFIEIVANIPLRFEPGERYLYSNPGYFLLGKIIEKVTGAHYSESLQKLIFFPLGMHNSGVIQGFDSPSKVVKGYRWKNDGGYRVQDTKNMSLLGAGAAIYTNSSDLFKFDRALYGNKLINKQSKTKLFNAEYPYSWNIGRAPISEDRAVSIHHYNGQFEGYSSMMARFIDDQHSIIILSNVGTSYFLKQQLILDIAATLYNQPITTSSKDASLSLIKALAEGAFASKLATIKAQPDSFELNEYSLNDLAYQLLWSNLGEKSLALFSFIVSYYPESSSAKKNLAEACSHRLTSDSNNRKAICL